MNMLMLNPRVFNTENFPGEKMLSLTLLHRGWRGDAKALIYSQGEQLHTVRGPAAHSRVGVASASAGGQTVTDMTNARSAVVCHSSELCTAITQLWICIQPTSNGFSVTKGKLRTANRSQICLRITFILLTHQQC